MTRLNTQIPTPRFTGIYVLEGLKQPVECEVRQLLGAYKDCLWGFKSEDNDAKAVILTDSDIDAFWQQHPGCSIPSLIPEKSQTLIQRMSALFSFNNWKRFVGEMMAVKPSRHQVTKDPELLREAVFDYWERNKEQDVSGQPVHYYTYFD